MDNDLNNLQRNTAEFFLPKHRDVILKAYRAPLLDRAKVIFDAGHVHGQTQAVRYITSCIATLDRQA